METVLHLIIVALVVAGAWFAFQPRYHFVVRVEGETARTESGKVTATFLREVSEICREHGVRRGVVYGQLRRRQIVLSFSRGIPASCQQRLRNFWAYHA